MFYEEQKRDKIKAAQEEVRKAKEEESAKKKLEGGSGEEKDASEEYPIDDPVAEEPLKEGTTLEDMGCEDGSDEPLEQNQNIGFSPTSSKSPKEDDIPLKKGSEVSTDIKDSLESDDPWMQRKKDGDNDGTKDEGGEKKD